MYAFTNATKHLNNVDNKSEISREESIAIQKEIEYYFSTENNVDELGINRNDNNVYMDEYMLEEDG